jgi:ATP-dependent DNA ligase
LTTSSGNIEPTIAKGASRRSRQAWEAVRWSDCIEKTKALHQAEDRRDHDQRQERRGDHAADHEHCDALHDLRAGAGAPHDRQQSRHDGDHGHIGLKASLPGFIEPALAIPIEKVPSGERWIHEIQFDGYRVQAHLANEAITIFTRRGHDWTNRFKKVAHDACRIKAGSAIVDGEIVVPAADGSTDFSQAKDDESVDLDTAVAFNR